mgnify:CR=1 FL=1
MLKDDRAAVPQSPDVHCTGGRVKQWHQPWLSAEHQWEMCPPPLDFRGYSMSEWGAESLYPNCT